MRIDGATVMVTGTNRGLGTALVEAFLQAGAASVYATMRKPDATIFSDPRVTAVALDQADAASVTALAAATPDLDILVNNAAALTKLRALGAPDLDGARLEMDTNYFGLLQMIRAFSPGLGRRGGGAISNILSISALAAVPSSGSYSASKAAAWSLTQSARAELKPQNTLVQAVFAGPIATAMARPGNPTPRCPPEVMAANVVEALKADQPMVFPDPRSAAVAEQFGQDPWALEQAFARLS